MSFRPKPLIPRVPGSKSVSQSEANLIKLHSQAKFLSQRTNLDHLSFKGDFVESLAIAAVTNSALIGAVVGGSVVGAVVGDLINQGEKMNNNVIGSKGLVLLAGFKILTLAIIFLSLMPPFSFAFVTLGVFGVASCIKSIQCVRTNNPDLRYFSAFSLIAFVLLICAVL